MPTVQHDTLNQIFHDHPEFAVRVLRESFGAELPADTPVQLGQSVFNDRISTDFDSDNSVIVGPVHSPVHAIAVEIQRKVDDDKRVAWSRYVAALWLALGCPVTVLVICPDTGTADWAAEPIMTNQPGFVVTPRVLGPNLIPVVTDAEMWLTIQRWRHCRSWPTASGGL